MDKTHLEWKSIFLEKPKDGESCTTRRTKDSKGYHGNTIWNERKNRFETIKDEDNRIVITIWKVEEWYSNAF
jgi:hypothetical protein